MRWPSLALVAVLGTAGCAQTIPPAAMPSGGELADEIAERAAQALAADARLDRADSLYAHDAELIADGTRRQVPPLYAGISAGQVSIGSSRVEVSGVFAWVLIEYRWFSTAQDHISQAQATIVFSRQADGQWRITHGHSSTTR